MYNTPPYTGGYYRPNNNYAQRLASLEQQMGQYGYYPQPQPQTIQNVNPQAVCYFVNKPDELNTIQNIMPNNFYVGINTNANEIYVRKMNNDGLIQLETYTLSANVEEKNDYKRILEQLAAINEKLTLGKETADVKPNTKPVDTGKTARAPANESF